MSKLTDEQIKQALEASEVKDAIKAAVDDAIKGLKTKNSELLGKIKELNENLSTLQNERDEIETEVATKSGDIEKIKSQIEAKHKKELDAIRQQLQAATETNTKLNGQLETHVVGESLTAALVKAKVQPGLMEAAKDHIRARFKGEVGENDGKPFAKFDGKAVDEFVSGWVQTETGKNFVSASGNSGGGSNGANGNGKAVTGNTTKKQMARSEFEALAPADKVKMSREVSLVDG